MKKRSRKTPQQAGRKAEVKAANKFGARLHVASGALNQKADMTKEDFTIESKATTAQYLKIEHSWLTKVAREARDMARKPALLFQFVDINGNSKEQGEWIAIPSHLFNELLNGD